MTTALTEAYHAIYDVKDEFLDNELLRIKAYAAAAALANLMEAIGVEVPTRFDGEGRPPTGDGTPTKFEVVNATPFGLHVNATFNNERDANDFIAAHAPHTTLRLSIRKVPA